jgi:hypothetical protein
VTGKKKATGMSRRQSFLDPAVIAENKSIMRYNRETEAVARGETLPPETERGPRREGRDGRSNREGRPARDGRTGRPARSGGPPGSTRSEGGSPPSGEPRAPRVGAEEEARLRDAVLTAAGETGLDVAGRMAVDGLVAHGGFDKATGAGWVVAVGERPGERAPEEWELLRAAWSRVRIALLEVWVVGHPSSQAMLDRERKEVAKAERQRRGPRPSARSRPPGHRRPRPGPPTHVPGPATETTEATGDGPQEVVSEGSPEVAGPASQDAAPAVLLEPSAEPEAGPEGATEVTGPVSEDAAPTALLAPPVEPAVTWAAPEAGPEGATEVTGPVSEDAAPTAFLAPPVEPAVSSAEPEVGGEVTAEGVSEVTGPELRGPASTTLLEPPAEPEVPTEAPTEGPAEGPEEAPTQGPADGAGPAFENDAAPTELPPAPGEPAGDPVPVQELSDGAPPGEAGSASLP